MKASRKWTAGLAIVLIVFAACQRFSSSSAPGITITGVIKGAGNGVISLSELDINAVKPMDSIHIGPDGRFSFEFKTAGSSFYLLELTRAQKLILVADSGDHIGIDGDARNIIATARIQGSPSSALLLDFERITLHHEATSDSIGRVFLNSRSDPGFARIRQHLDSAYQEIFSRQRLYMEKFIDRNPSSLASLLVLNRKFGPNFVFTEDKDARYFIKVDSGLMARYPGNKHALDHHARTILIIKRQKQRQATDSLIMPGKPVPDVRLSNAEGIPVRLSSLRGKVVLAYFWAAMDGQSRRFVRQLIPLYKANLNKGFTIYGIALEPNKALWLSALKLDQPGGIQVNAEGGTDSPVASLFGVESIPSAMLIDRQGKIIMRNISPDELRKKLPAQLQLK